MPPAIPATLVASVDTATSTNTKTALPLMRELVAQRRLRHDGDTELASQVASLLVTETSGGLTVSTRSGRSDLVRAAAWAVAASVAVPHEQPMGFFVY